jgi:hypothetical protein
MRKMRELGIKPSATGGNDWSLEADAHSGMDGYIHLCLLSEHPMEWLAKQKKQIEESTFLRVRPEIMRLEGVMMTAEVANKSGVAPCSPNELLGSLDLEVIYGRTDWKLPEIRERRKAAKLYEILIPEHVPAAMILNLDG